MSTRAFRMIVAVWALLFAALPAQAAYFDTKDPGDCPQGWTFEAFEDESSGCFSPNLPKSGV